MIVTIRSSSSEVISPALVASQFLLLLPSLIQNIPLGQVNIGLLANQVGISSTDTLNSGQGVHNLLLAIDVGVEETQDELNCILLVSIGTHVVTVLTVRLLSTDKRHGGRLSS